MSDPIDFDAKRKEKQEKLASTQANTYFCECGGGMFRLWDDGIVECLNCASAMASLAVVDEELPFLS